MRPESYSSLKTFLECPRQYRAKYVDHDLPYEQSPAAARGEAIHAAMEKMLKDWPERTPVPDEPAITANAERFLDILRFNHLWQRGWSALTEFQMAITDRFEQVLYNERRAWLRGRLDLVMAPPLADRDAKSPVVLVDWKTGKTPGDELQLAVGAALLFPVYGIGRVMGVFAYLDQGIMTSKIFEDPTDVIGVVRGRMEQVEEAWTRNSWPANPGGPGCRWCRMKERCADERGETTIYAPPVVA